MFTCYAAVPAAFARVIFYATFSDYVRTACYQFNVCTARELLNDICGDVWRACKRNNDVRAWELFKLYANRYLHETQELAADRVLTFTWAGQTY